MLDNVYAVIMAGGRGERFWPLSTSKHPKQVLSLIGNKPMLAMAIDYVNGLIPPERILIITSEDLVNATCEAAPMLPRRNIIGEPFGRDTAACVALASAIVKSRHGSTGFCILTADHVIENLDTFQSTLRDGFDLAMSMDVLITIGIRPAFPSTAFGYIEAGSQIKRDVKTEFFLTKRFVEKPNIETAGTYVKDGNFLW
ncbi:MAG: NTP transferase domain-containing protein, partial [Lentisphaerae bacterium]|nr:NTP transferase domain-containing protein [Lentisphaerota bacterium]